MEESPGFETCAGEPQALSSPQTGAAKEVGGVYEDKGTLNIDLPNHSDAKEGGGLRK